MSYQQIRMPLICGFAGIASIILAFTNEQGLVIQDSIELGVTGATVFYAVSAVVFFGIAAFTLPMKRRNPTTDCVRPPAPAGQQSRSPTEHQ